MIISVDLGGTNISSALVSSKKGVIKRNKFPTDTGKGSLKLVKDVVRSIEFFLEKTGANKKKIKSLVIGVPGTVDPGTGLISTAPNLNIKNFNIKAYLQEYFSFPVMVENDVNLAGLGIKKYELSKSAKNFMVVFIGTGIGAALFFDRKLYRGSTFYAGEIGHMKVSEEGYFRSSGMGKSFEEVASRNAIVNAIEEEIKNGRKSLLTKNYEKGNKIKSRSLASALDDGDDLVIEQISKACRVIGTVLASLSTLLNLDTIVLGGGLIEAMPDYTVRNINNSFTKNVLKESGENVEIIATNLGDDAPLLGGMALYKAHNEN